MNEILRAIEAEQMRNDLPNFNVGDNVKLHVKVKEGNRERIQMFEGYFWGLQITADGDCSHEIKRCLLIGRKVMTNLDSILSHSVGENSCMWPYVTVVIGVGGGVSGGNSDFASAA